MFENSTNLLLELTINSQALKDAMKPNGDAVNADGTLKDANKMDWASSPTETTMRLATKRTHSDDEASEDNDNVQRAKRLWVSPSLIQHSLEADNDIGEQNIEHTIDDKDKQLDDEPTEEGSDSDGSTEGNGRSESEDDADDDRTKKFWQAVAKCKGGKVNKVRHHGLCT